MTLEPADTIAIEQLLAQYNHLADSGDGEGFAACFVADGSLDTGASVVAGRELLTQYGNALPSRRPGIRHFTSNVLIDGNEDNATVRLYLLVYHKPEGAETLELAASGRYEDTLCRTDEGWRFVTRTMTPDR